MDCVTTRLQMEIVMCFLSLIDPEKGKEIGKIGEIVFGGPKTDTKFRENDWNRSSEIQKFSRENVEFFGGQRQNLSSGPLVGKCWETLLYDTCVYIVFILCVI